MDPQFEPHDGWSARHLGRGRRWFVRGLVGFAFGFAGVVINVVADRAARADAGGPLLAPLAIGLWALNQLSWLAVSLGFLFLVFGVVTLLTDRLARR